MPTYEYQCTRCHHRFDVRHGMSERPKLACPECGSLVQKLASMGAGILFSEGFRETEPSASQKTPCNHSHDHAAHAHSPGFPCYWNRTPDFSTIDDDEG